MKTWNIFMATALYVAGIALIYEKDISVASARL